MHIQGGSTLFYSGFILLMVFYRGVAIGPLNGWMCVCAWYFNVHSCILWNIITQSFPMSNHIHRPSVFHQIKNIDFPASKIEHCSPIQNVVLIPYASHSLKLIWQAYFIAFVGVFIIAKLFVLKIVYFSAMGMLAGSRAEQRRRTPNIWLDVRHHPGELSHYFPYEGKKGRFLHFSLRRCHFIICTTTCRRRCCWYSHFVSTLLLFV